MNVADFTYLLQHPDEVVSPEQTQHLEEVLAEYPYFQAAHALHLKGLKNLNSFKYNNALKRTAAYTADREILFDFITSPEFSQNNIADTIAGKTAPLSETPIVSEEVNPNEAIDTSLIESTEDSALPQNLKDAEQILDPQLFTSKDPEIDEKLASAKKKANENLEIGSPLPFTKKEKYSFHQWLQLTANRSEQTGVVPKTAKVGEDKQSKVSPKKTLQRAKKFEIIDAFIAQNPKIVPQDKITSSIDPKESSKWDKHELMTETLAKVYLEQKNYKKAIQSYKILSLKYPEKSSFFADRIEEIEKIQQNNV
ncbi:hypothetical protein U1E44_05285 [Arenibacter sp. GZD96]|uniref:hypothetical protein n=1 Tax=Aurantibrevibacter litoralis TaxID=3106030 RepID=UPI002AFF37CB|nr:hypothetical protein [Arenibacter sp. GZD-96]MEA1785495.1 hypothetical protein [Arenibacter sp. GZD-96]